MSRVVFVSVEGDAALAIADTWPDGDVPEQVTPEAVLEVLSRGGRLDAKRWLDEWDLLDGLRVTVQVPNPHWRQDTALLPKWAPPRYQQVEVFS